jgi:hypothetical protein
MRSLTASSSSLKYQHRPPSYLPKCVVFTPCRTIHVANSKSLASLRRMDSRSSSLGPSDSASQQTGSHQSILDPATEQLMEALMELVEPPPTRPSYVLKSILWDFEDCLNPAEGIIVTEANRRRPRMVLAIRCIDGRLILGEEFKVIHRVAKAIARALITSIIKDPHAVVFNNKPRTKSTLKKFFEPEYNQALLELEAHSKLLRLCSAHWKADHMIGQVLLNQGDADVDKDTTAPTAPHCVPSSYLSHPNKALPSDPYSAFIPQVSDVAPVSVAKWALELSPGPKSPSAVHTQKRSKDTSIVPGKKSDSECPS